MGQRRWLVAIVCVAAGCGRLDYGPRADDSPDAAVEVMDAGVMDSSAPLDGDAPAPRDASRDSDDDDDPDPDECPLLGSPCEWTCTDARCDYECDEASVCDAICPAGARCGIDCESGAVCTLQCADGPEQFCVGPCELECDD